MPCGGQNVNYTNPFVGTRHEVSKARQRTSGCHNTVSLDGKAKGSGLNAAPESSSPIMADEDLTAPQRTM